MSFKRLVTLMAVCTMLMVLVAPSVFAQRAAQPPPAPAGTVTFNTVITKLKAGQHVFCQSISRPDTALCRQYARSGADYVWIEMQHSRMDWETVDQMIQICASEGVPPFVRVPQVYAPDDIQRAADAGALGIIVPMVESVEVVMNAVRWFRNPIMDINNPSVKPWGFRSSGNGGARLWGPDYGSNWNNNCFIMLQIESPTGVDELEHILQVCEGGVQAVMVASSDFGLTAGDRDGDATYNAREKVVHDVVLAHGLTLVGPSRWYGDPNHPGYTMYQGMGPDSIYEH
ncbi:HpcH/HpaI aldolase/citrate lyase family protein [Candidatus Latescibacterota bacterium]